MDQLLRQVQTERNGHGFFEPEYSTRQMGEQEIQVEESGKRVLLGEEKMGTESEIVRALGKRLHVWGSIAKSRMKGDFQVRFRERLWGKFLRPTRPRMHCGVGTGGVKPRLPD